MSEELSTTKFSFSLLQIGIYCTPNQFRYRCARNAGKLSQLTELL